MNRVQRFLFAGGLLMVLLACKGMILSTTPTPTTEASPTDPDVIVIEGRVDEINQNIITISNTQIEIDINDPILAFIQVGDVVQLEGKPRVKNNVVIIVVINIISIDKAVIIIDNGTDPLPSNCKITKKGHIKCSKKKP